MACTPVSFRIRPRAPSAFQASLPATLAGVLDGDPQAGHAGVHVHDVLPAAQQGDDPLGLAVLARSLPGRRRGRGGLLVAGVVSVVAQTARGGELELADHEVGDKVADDEEHDAADDEVQHVAAQAGGKAHGQAAEQLQVAEGVQPQVDDAGHGKGHALQHRIDHVQGGWRRT